MIYEIVAIGGLLLLLIFFNGAETALTGASQPLMHQLEAEGNRRAGRVNRLRARKDRMLGAILLGNTLTQILASSLATSIAIALLGRSGIAAGTAATTLVVLIFCEILPKTVAIRRPNRVALTLAMPLRAIVWLFGPIVAAVQVLVDGMLRIFGVKLEAPMLPEAALAELRGAIAIHGARGAIRDERKMLRSILDLGDVAVSEVMIHRSNLAAIDADQPIEAVIDQIAASPHTRLALWRGAPDNVIGVIHSKTLLRVLRERGGDLAGLDIAKLADPPWFIPESTSLLEQMQAFRRRRDHLALVVDEYGALQGVVTLEDIIEEIVGEMPNEPIGKDQPVSGVRPQSDGTYVVDGDVTIRDLNREFDWNLPDENAATIAGLLLHESRAIPDVGQQFLFHGFRFEVVKRQRNRVTAVRVTPPSRATPPTGEQRRSA
jgi:Mg2+/Co2+ transporter CorB